ncbi:MAG: hypothetical protein RLZZ597_3527 [Cyanobacteriota bacterium]
MFLVLALGTLGDSTILISMLQPSIPRIALLIDADNVSGLRDIHLVKILNQLESLGSVTLRRAYGHWGKPHLTSLAKVLHRFAILPVQQFDYSSGKNATDIALTIDAMDLLHSGQYEAFALVTCDSDFTPLVVRLRTSHAKVYGFGRANKTSQAFQEACNGFLIIEDPKGTALAPLTGSETSPSAPPDLATPPDPDSAKRSPSAESVATIPPTPPTASLSSDAKAQGTATTAKAATTATASNKATVTEVPKPIEEVFKQAVTANLKNGWAKVADVGAFLAKHKKLKKNYSTQTWAKYYQRFPHLFEVKKVNGSTSIRMQG